MSVGCTVSAGHIILQLMDDSPLRHTWSQSVVSPWFDNGVKLTTKFSNYHLIQLVCVHHIEKTAFVVIHICFLKHS